MAVGEVFLAGFGVLDEGGDGFLFVGVLGEGGDGFKESFSGIGKGEVEGEGFRKGDLGVLFWEGDGGIWGGV